MKSKVSAFSGASLFCLSSYIIPAPEKSLSNGTEVGGAERYRLANLASSGYRTLLFVHQVSEEPLWKVISGSLKYLSIELEVFLSSSISAPTSSNISEKHFKITVLVFFM